MAAGQGMEVGETRIVRWIDEDGKRVEIHPFFSQLFEDNDSEALSKAYSFEGYDTSIGTLGKAEIESVAGRLLRLYKAEGRLVGVDKDELDVLYRGQPERFYVDGLISEGYFRIKKVMGKRIVFPTEKLMKNQRIPKRNTSL